VRGEKNRAPGSLELFDQIPELAPRLRVEPRRRLVEEQQIGIADERAREREPLLLTAGQCTDARAPHLLELNELDDVIRRRPLIEEAAEQPHGLLDRELVGELRLLELNSKALLERSGVGFPAQAEHLDIARVACREAFADLDRGGLARAVRPEQAEALAGSHLEIEAVHGDDVLVRLAQIANAQHRSWHPVHLLQYESRAPRMSRRNQEAYRAGSGLTTPATLHAARRGSLRKIDLADLEMQCG
jgi:hypothetical protein